MKETYGVPVEEIQEAIKHGVRKINIDTDIRLAMTGAVRKFLAENPDKFDARDWLKPAREAAKQICKQRYIAVRLRRPGRQDQGPDAAGRRRPVRQGRAGASRPLTRRMLAIIQGPLPSTGPFAFPPAHDLCPAHLRPHLAAAARARQGARQLRRRQRPHPDGRQRPAVGLRRDHGRADPGKGELLTQMALFWFGKLGHLCPNHLTGEAPESVVDAGRGAAGHGPLDAGQAPEADPGGSRGARLPGRQRLEGIPGVAVGLRRARCRRA